LKIVSFQKTPQQTLLGMVAVYAVMGE